MWKEAVGSTLGVLRHLVRGDGHLKRPYTAEQITQILSIEVSKLETLLSGWCPSAEPPPPPEKIISVGAANL